MNNINKSYISTKLSCTKCSFEKVLPISTYRNKSKLKCPRPECSTIFPNEINCIFDLHQYADISPDAFTHPLDRQAILALRKVPGFDYVLKKMMEFGFEKFVRVNSMANDVKVSSKTCSHIHDMAVQASKCLGLPVPDVFINQSPVVNASTMGVEYPIISIQSGLIELLTEDELYAVIAHEMTHIKCHHVLYHMLAEFLVFASNALGLVGGFIAPLNYAIHEWHLKSELSADRGALIVTNNKDASIKLLMKIAGGSAQLANMIDEEEFVIQAQQYEKMTEGIGLNKMYKICSRLNMKNTHPSPVLRAYEINKWADSDDYKLIYNRDYTKRIMEDSSELHEVENCPHCGANLKADAVYCNNCGQSPCPQENQYDQSGYESLVSDIKGGVNYALNFFGSKKDQNIPFVMTKICPKCEKEFFELDVNFCPVDGSQLIESGNS